MIWPLISIFILLTSCTYSINMVHTSGTASDVVDENQTASPDVSPTIPISLSSLKAHSNGPRGPT